MAQLDVNSQGTSDNDNQHFPFIVMVKDSNNAAGLNNNSKMSKTENSSDKLAAMGLTNSFHINQV